MTFRSLGLGIFLSLALASTASAATTIDITYTGTATGSWEGNYSPFEAPHLGFGSSGTIDQTTFVLNLFYYFPDGYITQNTSAAIFFPPSYESASFVSPVYSFGLSTDAYPGGKGSDSVAPGSTFQSLTEPIVYHVGTGSISISSYSPDIPNSILSSFAINTGLTGNGIAEMGYADIQYGGGMIGFFLTPETISVSVITSPVPESSTWAMMLIGFAGLGYLGTRRRSANQWYCAATK